MPDDGKLIELTFAVQYRRMLEATNCITPRELARILAVRQSDLVKARQSGAVPAAWLIKLLEKYNINPNWIKYGLEPEFIRSGNTSAFIHYSNNPFISALAAYMQNIDAQTMRTILRYLSTKDLVAELQRRENYRQG